MAEIKFPNEEDFSHEQNDELVVKIKDLRSRVLDSLLKIPFSDYSKSMILFLEKKLPNIWKTIIQIERPPRSIMNEIQSICQLITKLAIHTNLNPYLIEGFIKTYGPGFSGNEFLEIVNVSDSEKEELLKFDDNEQILRQKKFPGTSAIRSLTQNIIKSGIFTKADDMFISHELTTQQLIKLNSLFDTIAFVLNPKYVSIIFPRLVDYTLTSLKKGYSPELDPLCTFISSHGIFLNTDQINQSIKYFCIALNHPQSTQESQITIISSFSRLLPFINTIEDENLLKTALMKQASIQTQSEPLNRLSNSIVTLTSKLHFSNKDLISIFTETNFSSSQKIECVTKAIESIDQPLDLDELANVILQRQDVSLRFYFDLITRVKDPQISHQLLDTVLNFTGDSSNLSCLNGAKDSEQLTNYVHEILQGDDLMKIYCLGKIFYSIPYLNTTNEYLMRIIELSKEHNELIQELLEFSNILDNFDSMPIIMMLFECILQQDPQDDYVNQLYFILSEWIEKKSVIPSEQILTKLLEIDYKNCSNSLPLFLNTFLLRCDDSLYKHICNVLFKILSDTIPKKHSNWFVNTIFYYIHDNTQMMKKFETELINYLKDSDKIDNLIYILYNAAIYEADFYNIKSTFGYIQNFKLIINEVKSENFKLSFHPFHSTRRLYYAISKHLGRKLNTFNIVVTEGTQEKLLQYYMPLPSILFNPIKVITLNINELEEPPPHSEEEEIFPTFLTLISKKVSILFHYLTDINETTEILFMILTLFQPIKLNAQYPLQNILIGNCTSVLEYGDSIRIFPFAMFSYAFTNIKSQPISEEIFKDIINIISNRSYDVISLLITISTFKTLFSTYEFDKEMIFNCLFQNTNEIFRNSIIPYISKTNVNINSFISLIELTTKKEFRARTKQFYIAIKSLNITNTEIFIPFYKDLQQFEFSHYNDIDETFIGLISLIPKTEETISLTINRLFSPPTCDNLTVPFIHTEESWNAALQFLLTPITIKYLNPYFLTLNFPETLVSHDFSNDFTYQGRNGIKNLGATCYINSIIQMFNGLKLFSLKMISLETNEITPFIHQLRDLLAKLRFIRGKSLSIKEFSQTIPKFNCKVQEDVEEFFNMILNKLNDDLPSNKNITDHLRGQFTVSIHKDENYIVSTHTEDFFYLSLQTQYNLKLKESFPEYFKEERIDYKIEETGENISAFRRTRISHWPDYLVIQLQRWEYPLITMERQKLINEFQFPLQLKTEELQKFSNADTDIFDYTLAGVIVHQGNAEQGHYFTIVQGDDDEWYLCNDKSIEYFDVNDIPIWSFGGTSENLSKWSPDEISTGYLLFYKKIEIEDIKPNIPKDLEEYLNKENQKNWPNIIFCSTSFITFVQNLLTNINPKTNELLEFSYNVLFKIIIQNNDILHQWVKFFKEKILNTQNLCKNFLNYIINTIDKDLISILMLSEKICNEITDLITNCFIYLNSPIQPLIILLNKILKRHPQETLGNNVLSFSYSIINTVLSTPNINFNDEDDLLYIILEFLSIPTRDNLILSSKQYIITFDKLMNILINITNNIKSANKITRSVFDINRLNNYNAIARKSESFKKLVALVTSLNISIFQDLTNATNATKSLLTNIKFINTVPKENDENLQDKGLIVLYNSIEKLLFNDSKEIRNKTYIIMLEILNSAIIDKNIYTKKSYFNNINNNEVNTIYMYIASLILHMNELIENGSEDNCYEYISLLKRAAKISSKSIFPIFIEIQKSIRIIKNENLLYELIDIFYNCINVLHQNIEIDEETATKILESNYISKNNLKIIFVLKDFASNTKLVANSVEYLLCNDFCVSENYYNFIDLIRNGLIVPFVNIPDRASCLDSLALALVLWNQWEDKRNELKVFMLSALELAKPFCIYKENENVKKCVSLLSEICNQELQVKINEISEKQ